MVVMVVTAAVAATDSPAVATLLPKHLQKNEHESTPDIAGSRFHDRRTGAANRRSTIFAAASAAVRAIRASLERASGLGGCAEIHPTARKPVGRTSGSGNYDRQAAS
ncbi:hypothetical protein [Antarcticirhabdus aurantiaca]|uniref:Uncharacterized protein n=1 Tax=Antarcticirhabdus aurantiaca TaxID=2606717 RepID=A0ACD4NLS3_9HYPH|nr:hypothetical protein [Antarcticirhabdus aurantiaca]WAJ27798.1 hypothetical protein OXU80_23625 [Jeongeuplla avenae]